MPVTQNQIRKMFRNQYHERRFVNTTRKKANNNAFFPLKSNKLNREWKKHCEIQDNWKYPKKSFFIKTIIWCLLFQVVKQRWMFSINKRNIPKKKSISYRKRDEKKVSKKTRRRGKTRDEETIFGNLFNTTNINN